VEVIDGTCGGGIPHSGETELGGGICRLDWRVEAKRPRAPGEGTRVEFWIPDARASTDNGESEAAA
jgi:hypothetical protein